MKVTFYGHACFGVEVMGKHLLFDPFISPNEKAKHINLADVKADFILLTHGHADHVADAIELAKQNDATVVSNFEVVGWINAQGWEKTHPMNHGGSWKFDFGTAKYVNAIHTSSMPDGSYGGNPGGFVISTDEGNFYHAGDTALTYDMKLIADSHRLKFAMLPIGDNFTMGVDDAVVAADFINCKEIIGMHFDTFGYIVVDHEEAVRKFEVAGKKLTLMEIGQTLKM